MPCAPSSQRGPTWLPQCQSLGSDELGQRHKPHELQAESCCKFRNIPNQFLHAQIFFIKCGGRVLILPMYHMLLLIMRSRWDHDEYYDPENLKGIVIA